MTHISLDEKAYQQGHAYATILVDTSKNQILDMQEGRTEKEVKTLLKNVTGQTLIHTLKEVNI
ncbi:MAG: transposase [Phycisphaerales bacterium]|nr:transposase [Phycisphaerales bacterium]